MISQIYYTESPVVLECPDIHYKMYSCNLTDCSLELVNNRENFQNLLKKK